MIPIFDGHNDVLSKLAQTGLASAPARFRRDNSRHIDLERAGRGGLAGGLFAVWVPSTNGAGIDAAAMALSAFDIPLPPEVPLKDAQAAALLQTAIALQLERAGTLTLCRSARDVAANLTTEPLAAVLHLEGAEPIDRDLALLDVLHAAGLRSLGPVWSRPNRFGHGVPFRFPSAPDTGPGLTPHGERLVQRCNELRILVDVSHLTEAGFWDVARVSDAPLVATHSNAHALCRSSRNLTDRQLDAIRERDGLVGINFATAFLREDGRMLPKVPVSRIVAHMDYLIERLGETRLGLGSDYDGAGVPEALDGVEHLPALVDAMRAAGYGEGLIARICHENWLRVLKATFGG